MHDLLNIETRPRRRRQIPTPRPSPPVERISTVGSPYLRQQLVTSLPLLVSDLLGLAIVFGSISLTAGAFGDDLLRLFPYLALALFTANAMNGLYPAVGIHPAEEFRKCGISTSTMAATALSLAIASSDTSFGHFIVGIVIWLGLLVGIPMTRSAARILAGRFDFWAQPVLIVGDIREGIKLTREMLANRTCGLRPIGIISDPASHWLTDDKIREEDVAFCIGTLDEAASIAKKRGVYRAVIITNGQEAENALGIERYLYNIPHRLYIYERKQRDERDTLPTEPTRFYS